jgi:mannose-6-phosphate isomerase-like protein (cupin superfamily)
MKQTVSTQNSEHYPWGENAHGWWLLKNPHLSVVQEKAPPGNAELRHCHHQARQFIFVLEGEATVELESDVFVLNQFEGIEIPPKAYHQFRNESDKEVTYLVISSPLSQGDRSSVNW